MSPIPLACLWLLVSSFFVSEAATTTAAVLHLHLEHGLKLNVSVGTPAQNFSLVLNTVATGAWVRQVYGVPKDLKVGSLASDEKRLYRAESSSTSSELGPALWRQEYSVGLVYIGKMFKDRLQIGTQLILEEQPLQVLNLELGHLSGWFRHDGMLGLGGEGRLGLEVDPIRRMHELGLIPNRTVSLHLDQRDERQQYNGTLLLGGTDPRYYEGPISYVPATRLWELELDVVQFARGSAELSFQEKRATIDSTSNIIFGPTDEVGAIFGALNLEYFKTYGLHKFPSCREAHRSGLRLTITMGGRQYALEASDLVIKLRWRHQEACFLALSGRLNHYSHASRENQHWILGTPFLKKYFTVFDYQRAQVGFANATTTTTTSNR